MLFIIAANVPPNIEVGPLRMYFTYFSTVKVAELNYMAFASLCGGWQEGWQWSTANCLIRLPPLEHITYRPASLG